MSEKKLLPILAPTGDLYGPNIQSNATALKCFTVWSEIWIRHRVVSEVVWLEGNEQVKPREIEDQEE